MKLYEFGGASQVIGALALAASKLRYNLADYTPRRDPTPANADEGPLYEIELVDGWRRMIAEAAPGFPLAGRDVLEIGPGSSLGTGVLLTALGAARYTAYDIHDLATRQPVDRYRRLLRRYAEAGGAVDPDLPAATERALQNAAAPDAAPIRFALSKAFDFSEFAPGEFDLVVSNAAFEHVRDPAKTIAALTRACRPGALFYAWIDLKAHGRWVRRRDPLNIYRLPGPLYDFLSHPAAPNRVRPAGYAAALQAAGWTDVRLRSVSDADPAYAAVLRDQVRPEFRDDWLACLSLVVTARLGG